jgi:predicted RNA-binding Zn ribbon-like protein
MDSLISQRFPPRLGGHIALDFTNTAEFRGSADAREFLRSYEHVVTWCEHAEILPADGAARLRRVAAHHAPDSALIFQQIVDLRESVYRIVRAVAQGERPQRADLAALNAALHQARQHQQLAFGASGFAWSWSGAEDDLRLVLWMLALHAADLLTSPQLERARQCPNCGRLFVDTSRNGKRRWCSMDFCGSKMKSRRQYARRKAGGAQPAR